MFIKDIKKCKYIDAIDETRLSEILHPDRDGLKIDYSLAYAIVKKGKTTKPHKLKTSTEVYYILEGLGTMFIDDEISDVSAGQAIYIPPNSCQYIKNIGDYDLKFLCIVYPPWKAYDEEV
jgi:mannose-6-phosphate isomerase-like protein (cupin superfamily)